MLSTVSRAYNPRVVRSTNQLQSGSTAVQPTQSTTLTAEETPPRGPIEVAPRNTYQDAPTAPAELAVEGSTTFLLPQQDTRSTALEVSESQGPRRRPNVPPRRRDSQPPATPEDADIIPGLDPIAESATKDDKRLIKRLIKLMGELNKTVQAAERDLDLGHNAQGETIRMPDTSHEKRIHQAVRELLAGSNSAELRYFQETSVKMNQIITVSGVVTEHHMLTQVSGNTRSNESS